MKIDLANQIGCDPALPLLPLRGYTGSALLAELCGIPDVLCGFPVASVAVSLVTPDAEPVTAAAEKAGGEWRALFAASCFAGYGTVRRGFRVTAALKRADGTTFNLVLGVGNLEILAGSPEATPGDPSRTFVQKGGDVYLKSTVVDNVQHYVKQVMEYDAEIGWGATWTGDYILVNGEFTEAEVGQ